MNLKLSVLSLIMAVGRADVIPKSHDYDKIEKGTVAVNDGEHKIKMSSLETGNMLRGFNEMNDCSNGSCCDCEYHSGGCVINSAPASDLLCKCVYKDFWNCEGYPIGCDPNDDPDGCCADGGHASLSASKQCCKRGGGDCGGY